MKAYQTLYHFTLFSVKTENLFSSTSRYDKWIILFRCNRRTCCSLDLKGFGTPFKSHFRYCFFCLFTPIQDSLKDSTALLSLSSRLKRILSYIYYSVNHKYKTLRLCLKLRKPLKRLVRNFYFVLFIK